MKQLVCDGGSVIKSLNKQELTLLLEERLRLSLRPTTKQDLENQLTAPICRPVTRSQSKKKIILDAKECTKVPSFEDSETESKGSLQELDDDSCCTSKQSNEAGYDHSDQNNIDEVCSTGSWFVDDQNAPSPQLSVNRSKLTAPKQISPEINEKDDVLNTNIEDDEEWW